ncbi:2-hydroxyacid dehydrogenase [Pelosinus propionicus]|uniref:D-3-phosphoglycerate dehydrogenase n=1 Tax=Pelosinus propionicus DSM 13327 TaxID=1123291 RepID=A0A1I4H5P7_9FIRM|nr:2-hydroxyacid dehydrogenase [Pelosinus propionicus]SFL36721.1 D-3-phosphoglycerate dehydrogenase [Pelosinus propionicus DSM 13327]
MKILVVGDTLVSADYMEDQAKRLLPGIDKEIVKFDWEVTTKEEFQKIIFDLEKNGPEARVLPNPIIKELERAEVFLGHFAPLSEEILDHARNLKLIGTCRGGIEHIDIEAATKKNIPVIHVIRNAEPVAEFTLSLILNESRNITRSHEAIKKGLWLKTFPNSEFTTVLSEKKIGLLGLGAIGKLVAKKMGNLGVQVIAYDPYLTKESLEQEGIQIDFVSIKELFQKADIVSLHTRLTKETQNMVNLELLSLMKPSAYLINTARAGIIDEDAIIKILQEKKIAGAALDVFWQEPIPKDHPLLKLENVTLTSHIAGDTVDAIPKAPKLLVNEMIAFLDHGKSDMVVNYDRINWRGWMP